MPMPPHQPVTLAVETSGSRGSLAVGIGPAVLAYEAFDAQNSHSVALLPTADRLLRAHSLSPSGVAEVYVSAGPGSFTGLRIGITFARAIALGTGARIVSVPSLAVIAQNALALPDPPNCVAVILDAKRQHVFAQCFKHTNDAYVAVDEPLEREPAAYLRQLGEVGVLGEGVERHAAALAACPQARVLPRELHAASASIVYALGCDLAARGSFTHANALTPIYIRRPEAEERWEQRQAAG